MKGLKFSFLRRNMAVVSQEPILFAISARENIAFGVEDPDQQKLQEAAKLANCASEQVGQRADADGFGWFFLGLGSFGGVFQPFYMENQAKACKSRAFELVGGRSGEVIALSPSGSKAMTPWWANEAFSFPEAGHGCISGLCHRETDEHRCFRRRNSMKSIFRARISR